MPKLSTTNVKLTGRVLCFHRDGVILHGLYQYTARLFARQSWAIFLACWSPGINFLISTYPITLTDIAYNLYGILISFEIRFNGICVY